MVVCGVKFERRGKGREPKIIAFKMRGETGFILYNLHTFLDAEDSAECQKQAAKVDMTRISNTRVKRFPLVLARFTWYYITFISRLKML